MDCNDCWIAETVVLLMTDGLSEFHNYSDGAIYGKIGKDFWCSVRANGKL